MYNLFHNIILNTNGVVNDELNIKPVRYVQIKDIINFPIYLRIYQNKIEIFGFDKDSSEKISEFPGKCQVADFEIADYKGLFAEYIYAAFYYRIKFKPLTYSMNVTGNKSDEELMTELLIPIYSENDKPKEYFPMYNDLFDNMQVISTLLYKEEVNNYIDTFKYHK